MPALKNTFSSVVAILVIVLVCCYGVSIQAQVTVDRVAVLEDYHGYYPCMDCHEDQETIIKPRILEEEHAEPLEWEDDDGQVHLEPFGQKVPLGELMGQLDVTTLYGDNLARIGERLDILSYMADNDLSPADSVWTLVHGGGNLWCLDCHDVDNRDKLVKLNGELLSFNESELLCGECHGPILRDWEIGIHGKTVGFWDPIRGDEEQTVRLLCVECHQPHRPTFSPQQPMAPPVLRVDGPGNKAHQVEHQSEQSHSEESSH